jgi:hypothetical protein
MRKGPKAFTFKLTSANWPLSRKISISSGTNFRGLGIKHEFSDAHQDIISKEWGAHTRDNVQIKA